jgi:uncharacterized protein YndB with AHSA1/START domain
MAIAPFTHDTFAIERTYPRSAAIVFGVFSEPDKKRRWYADSEAHKTLSYSLDFRVGGQEELAAEMLPGTPIAGARLRWSSRFVNIVPDERIVFSQVLDVNDNRISCALVTVALTPAPAGCHVAVTHQAVFFEGADGPEMRRMGWVALLDRAQQFVEAE